MGHDRGYKSLLSHPEAVAALLRTVLPEMAESFVWDSLRSEDTTQVSGSGSYRTGDLAFTVDLHDGRVIGCALLLEVQERAPSEMALRLLEYAVLFWRRARVEPRLLSAGSLPPVVGIVFYHGDGPWRTPQDVWSAVDLPAAAELRELTPQMRYLVCDLHRLDAAGVDGESVLSLAAALAQATDRDARAHAAARIDRFCQQPARQALLESFRLLVLEARQGGRGGLGAVSQPRDLRPEEMEMAMSVSELVEQSYVKERQEGRQEGRQEALRETAQQIMVDRFGDAGRTLWEDELASRQNADWGSIVTLAVRATAPEDILGALRKGGPTQ